MGRGELTEEIGDGFGGRGLVYFETCAGAAVGGEWGGGGEVGWSADGGAAGDIQRPMERPARLPEPIKSGWTRNGVPGDKVNTDSVSDTAAAPIRA